MSSNTTRLKVSVRPVRAASAEASKGCRGPDEPEHQKASAVQADTSTAANEMTTHSSSLLNGAQHAAGSALA